MATLIPALGSCAGRMEPGERRLAERLEQKLEDDYLLWWDIPIGPKQTRPDFVVLQPYQVSGKQPFNIGGNQRLEMKKCKARGRTLASVLLFVGAQNIGPLLKLVCQPA